MPMPCGWGGGWERKKETNNVIQKLKGLSPKAKLTASGVFVLAVVVKNLIERYVMDPALQHISLVSVVLYNFLATAIVFLFLLAMVLAVWQSFRGGWHLVVKKERRHEIGEKIRQWPNSKWDLLPVIGFTYLVATMVPLLAINFTLPSGQLSSAMTLEQSQVISRIVFAPLLLILITLLIRCLHQVYIGTRQQWKTGTRRDRIAITVSGTFAVVGSGLLVVGDLAGIDHLLWFNAG